VFDEDEIVDDSLEPETVQTASKNEVDSELGQTRMEVAYGAGDGDDDAKAVVARKASMGVLYEQIYRPWNGQLGPRWVRNYAIFRHHVYGIFSSKGHRHYNPFVRLSILVIFLTSLTPIAMIFLSVTISGGEGSDWLNRMWGVNRYNLWGQVLGYFPRNLCMWPLLTALVVGGMISDDRKNGTSAIYFSRPVTRTDYTAMKYLSSAVVLGFVIVFSYMLYYTSAIVFNGEGWAYLIDTLPMFLGGLLAGILLVITYTSIGMALSSVSQSRFFAAIGFLAIIFGTKIVALMIELIFETTIFYILSPYDSLAHLGQWLIGIPANYEHSLALSIISVIIYNAASVGLLITRVRSLEVTRE
jgi:ABC-type transport system involved in multi-copper enzyme maturation permease subunit|tara:strand:+ start:1671 stop:2741 length:1071 start_codon:yes stop_codon:yes gene_type:complete